MGFSFKSITNSVNKFASNVSGVDAAKPLSRGSVLSVINPLKAVGRQFSTAGLQQEGKETGLTPNKLGKTSSGYPNGRPPETPVPDDSSVEESEAEQRRAQGRASTLLSQEGDEDTDLSNASILRRRLMAA